MTREAKIGMLTGLGVIVMIGVLLSKYLGDPKTGGPALAMTNGPTGQMADLGIGDNYRQQLMQPVGVPPVAGPGPRTMQAGGSEVATPIDGSDRAAPPAAFAIVGQRPVTAAVTPVPAGPTMNAADSRLDGPPIISLAEPTSIPVKAVDTTARPAAAAVMTYTISPGDSLGKISKKFYNSSKNSDIQRIVSANPGMLKDATTMLVAGKKLVIPGVAAPAAPGVATDEKPMTVYLPGDAGKAAPPLDTNRKVQPPVVAASAKTTVYVVQSGDTLEKISRKLAPLKVSDTVQRLISLNAIKDPHNLQVGAKLKVPA